MGGVTAASRQGDKQRLRRTVDGYLETIENPTPGEFKTYYNDRYFGASDGRSQHNPGNTAGKLKHILLDAADAGVGRNLAAYAEIVDGVGY